MNEDLSPELINRLKKIHLSELLRIANKDRTAGLCIYCKNECDKKAFFCNDSFYAVKDDSVDNGVTYISICMCDYFNAHKLEVLEIITS